MPPILTDEKLLRGINRGEEEAFKQLFQTYFEPLTFYANRYLKDLDSSRDLVQEVMSYIYENRENLDIRESFKAFLYRSVANRSLNLLKHEEVKQRHHAIIKERSDEHYQNGEMELSELQAKINRLMLSLPTECGRIFRMSRMDHKSNQEIADELGISKRTVETQISKALKVFRKALKLLLLQFFLENF